LPPLTCICGRLVCSWKEYLLCFSNHCCSEWRALTDSDRLLLRALEESIGSFRSRINQEFPKLTHELVDRLARAQLRQFGCVIENIGKHAQRAVHHGCNEYCFTKSLPHEVVDAFRGSFTSPFFLFPDKLSGIFECPCCLQVKVNTPYHIREHMQFFICMFPGCSSTFTDKIRWFHHVRRVHRQSKKWWECELCEYDTYWEQCMREHLVRSHKLSTSAVQLALTSNCRYDADKVIEQPCYFCHNLYTCEGLRDHLIEHMEHITSLLF
jgi:hypothetical protein